MKQVEKIYRCIPFWSWNDTLNKDELVRQVEWMNENGVGGFFMHARGGLKTEYLGKDWFECIKACSEKAKELGMEAYAYDENGWPSGFVGGKLLEDIENHDKYLTYEIGKYDESALVSYDISTPCLKRVSEDCDNCLNIYEHYSTSNADILNPEVVDKFLELTHEEYKKHDTYSLKGFFTDEPQYQRWGSPYTKMLPKYFKEVYNEDILDKLGLLFVEKRGYRDFRYKFWKAMQALMLENFGKRVYDWCDKNGYKLTGHYIEEGCLCGQMECCAGIMPFYEYEHIPGIDYLGAWIGEEMSAKQASSVAAQLGKKQVLTETFAGCGWDITPRELKMLAEVQYVGGVNLMCQHLLPYKEQGQRKRDYPVHFSSVNPWIKNGFKDFNDYFSYLGKALANSDEVVNVGVLHPIRSAYFDYKRFPENDYHGLGELERAFYGLMNKLCEMGIGHHFLDETILAKHARVEGKSLVVGKCRYDYIILPKMYTMDKSTDQLLSEFVHNDGKILLTDKKPGFLEGRRYNYVYLRSNTTFDEILENEPCKISNNKNVRITYRKDENGRDFIYCVNLGEEATVDFKLKNGSSFENYDIISDTYSVISTSVHFDKGESRLLYISNKKPDAIKELIPLYLGNKFDLVGELDNYITLDTLSYSLDGKEYNEPRHHMCVFSELLDKRYKGKLYLKYSVNIDTLPKKCQLLCEDTNTLGVFVNGNEATSRLGSDFEITKLCYDVASMLHTGKNEIVILIDYYQGEQVYYALFGENVTESLKNCLAYDTDIEPIYLKGDFGVYGDFENGKREDIYLGSNFTLGKQKSEIECLISDGFPFFAGKITLKQDICVDNPNYKLIIPSRFHIIDVKVNGEYAGKMMLAPSLDLSNYLKAGKNQLEITLCVSNRNLLGPFHTNEGEPNFVGPDTFERLGSWQDGKSSRYNEKYAFRKTTI